MLRDIAVLTGGQLISEEVGFKLENATLLASAPDPASGALGFQRLRFAISAP